MLTKLLAKLKYVALPLAVLAFFVLAPTPAHAAYTDNNIIDDSVFLNSSSMSQADIQSFLNSKGGALANYSAPNTDPGQNNRMMSAAEIIYFTSQYVGINPRVIMATMQKEESLITDPNPSSIKYDYAMGYGCPDSSGCAGSSGFYYQVVTASWQLRFNFERAGGSTSTWTSPNGKVWGSNPGYACPSATRYYSTGLYAGRTVTFYADNGAAYKTFNLDNRGTASMYCYTPHAYNPSGVPQYYSGSYNFVTSYESWWGSTKTTAYSATYAGQSAYPTIAPGNTSTGYIQYKNTGNVAWYDDTSRSSGPSGTLPTHLATNNPINRASQFGAAWGGDKNRPANNFSAVYESDGTTLAASQHIVQPGQVAKFSFNFDVPANLAPGLYHEYFRPVLDGSPDGAFTYSNVWIDVTISGTYSSTWYSQGSSPTLHPTESYTTYISYKNTGNVPWYDDLSLYGAPGGTQPVHLATSHTLGRASIFGATWGTDKNRPTQNFSAVYESNGTTLASNQHVVQPGQIGKFNIVLQTASQQAAGSFNEYFQPIVEGGTNMNDPGTYLAPVVSNLPAGSSTINSQTVTMTPGQTKSFTTNFVNIGNASWTPSSAFLQPDGSSTTAAFRASNWINSTKASAVNESSVSPGATGTFSLNITAPAQPGVYVISFAPGDGTTGFGNPNAKFTVTVSAPVYSATYANQSTYPNITPGNTVAAFISYKNTGNVTWYDDTSRASGPSGTLPTRLATGNPTNRASVFGATWGTDKNRPTQNFSAVYEADGTTLASDQHVVQPGQIGKFSFTFTVATSQTPSLYREYFRPVLDGSSDGAFTYSNVWLDVAVAKPAYSATWTSQSAYPTIAPGASSAAFISYKNTGNVTWYDDTSRASGPSGTLPTRLATGNPTNRASVFGATWGTDKNRPTQNFSAVYEADGTTLASDQHVVQPGQIGKFSFTFTVATSQTPSLYREYFRPVLDGSSDGAFTYSNVWLDVTIH